MADQYDAIVSGVPTDPQQQQALAAALRQRAAMARAYQATGDRVIAPLGKSIASEVDSQTADIGAERQRQAQAAAALAAHQDQMAHEAAQLQQQRAIADQNNQRQIEANQNNNQLRRDLQAEREQAARDLAAQKAAEKNAKAQEGKPIPAGTLKDIAAFKDSYDSIDNAVQTYKPEFSGAGKVSRNADNYMAANFPNAASALGLVSQTDKDAANWYQNYGRNFTIDEMHRLFGARISPTEMATFEKFHINPNQDAQTQMLNMQQIRDKVAKKLNDRLDALQAAGFSPGEIEKLRPTTTAPDGSPMTVTGTPADKYVAAAKAAKAAPGAPGAAQPAPSPTPAPMPIPPPTGSLLPQSVAPARQPGQLPYVPGLNNLFSGLPNVNS